MCIHFLKQINDHLKQIYLILKQVLLPGIIVEQGTPKLEPHQKMLFSIVCRAPVFRRSGSCPAEENAAGVI